MSRNPTGNYEASLGAGIEPTQLEARLRRQLREQRSLRLRELTRYTLGQSLKSDPERRKAGLGGRSLVAGQG